MSSSKEIYEALQAVNACLDATGEQLLVDLVEKIRTGLRHRDGSRIGNDLVDTTLRRWIECDAAEPAGDPEATIGPWSLPPALSR